MRYKLTIAYDGADFHGWQRQVGPDPERQALRTVAGVLEHALRRVLAQPVHVVGASRTDAGVHAKGQVAHFDAHLRIPIEKVPAALNSRLPQDLEVVAAQPVAPGFDAITSAVSKRYRYRIFNSPRRPLNKRNFVWHCWTPLEVEPMRDAGRRLVGEHDFAAFAAAGHGRASTVRTIHGCVVENHQPEVQVIVEGDGFLYHMVRIITGTLVEVARGRFSPDVIDRMLESGDRRQGGPTLPSRGLCLEWIRYEEEMNDQR